MKTPIQLEIDVGYSNLDFAVELPLEQLVLMRGTNTKMYHLIKMARNEVKRIYAGIRYHQAKLDALELEIKELEERLIDWGWEDESCQKKY